VNVFHENPLVFKHIPLHLQVQAVIPAVYKEQKQMFWLVMALEAGPCELSCTSNSRATKFVQFLSYCCRDDFSQIKTLVQFLHTKKLLGK
jgi:hypothetical protein